MEKNGILRYDPKTGLQVGTKKEIFDDIVDIVKTAYGNDFVIDEGTQAYTFCDLLSSTLCDFGNNAKQLYDGMSFMTASGTVLDFLCSLSGIVRKEGESDTQLRARHLQFLYKSSTSTVESLKAKLLEAGADKVAIYNNDTSAAISKSDKYNWSITQSGEGSTVAIPPHSIAVAIYTDNTQTKPVTSSTTFNNIITQYKSLGCGIATDYTDQQARYYIPANLIYPSIEIVISLVNNDGSTIKESITKEILLNIEDYFDTLSIGGTILYSAMCSCCYKAFANLQLLDIPFVIKSIKIGEILLNASNTLEIPFNLFYIINWDVDKFNEHYKITLEKA
jgi:hypothetical protein